MPIRQPWPTLTLLFINLTARLLQVWRSTSSSHFSTKLEISLDRIQVWLHTVTLPDRYQPVCSARLLCVFVSRLAHWRIRLTAITRHTCSILSYPLFLICSQIKALTYDASPSEPVREGQGGGIAISAAPSSTDTHTHKPCSYWQLQE